MSTRWAAQTGIEENSDITGCLGDRTCSTKSHNRSSIVRVMESRLEVSCSHHELAFSLDFQKCISRLMRLPFFLFAFSESDCARSSIDSLLFSP